MRGSLTELTLKRIKARNYTAAVITGWTTNILPPLGPTVDRSFEAVLQCLWEARMTEAKHSYTATWHMRQASFSEAGLRCLECGSRD